MDPELITYLTEMESRLGAKLDTGLAGVRDELRVELGGVRGEVRDLRGEVGGLRGEVADLQGLRGEVRDLRGEVGGMRSEVGNLRGEVRAIGVLVEHLDGRVQLLAEVVQAQGEQHERHHAEIWTELSSLNQRFTHLQARVLRPGDPS